MRRAAYRPFQAVAVGCLAALLTACAVLTPLYFRAMQQSVARVTVERASVLESGLQIWSTTVTNFDPKPVLRPEQVLAALPRSVVADFGAPTLGYDGNAKISPGDITDPVGDLIWRDGACDHLTLVQGRCPSAAGEIAVTEADLDHFGYRLGGRVTVGGAPDRSGVHRDAPDQVLTIVGTYEQSATDYWFGQLLTGRSGVVMDPKPSRPYHDAWITDRATFETQGWQPDLRSSYVGLRLDRRIGVDQLRDLGPDVDDLDALTPARGANPLTVASDLPRMVRGVEKQIDQSRVTVPLLMAQLCLLAVVVLWLVLLAVTEQRRPEVALARLRGRGRRGARALLLAELLPVTLLAVVPGTVLALLASWFARAVVLPGDAPFELGVPFVAAVASSALLLAVITLAAVGRVAREPVSQLLRRVPPRSSSWRLGATDAVVIAGAGGIVVVFATGGLEGPIALAAPGLLAIVVGLVLAHLTTPTSALLGRRQLRKGKVRSGVSLLDAARSPATRRIVAIVTLASALAVFSADALLVGQRNRTTASEQEVGAARVADLQGNDLRAVRAALDEVDPSGTTVTPVVRVAPPGKDAVPTIAVVPEGFRSVAMFGDAAPTAAQWDRLAVPDDAPIELTGESLAVTLVDAGLESERVDGKQVPVTVGLDLVTPAGETLHPTIAERTRGERQRRYTEPVSCTGGCKVTGVWFSSLPGATITGRVTLKDLVAGPSGESVDLGPADRWTAYSDRAIGRVRPSSGDPRQLTVEVITRGTTSLTLHQNWLPTIVPTFVAGELPPGSTENQFAMSGLDGEVQPAGRVSAVERVPASTPRVILANLDTLQRGREVAATDRLEVWFGDDSAALLARVSSALGSRGVEVASSSTLAGVRRSYDESSAAWSLQLAALVGAVAVVIALLVLVVSAVSSWRFRTRDLAALRMTGVPGGSVRSMAVAAQLPAVLVGVVAGGVSGLFGAQLAMSIVPLFATAPAVSTLDLDTAWGAVLFAVGVSLLVLGAGSVLIGRALASRADLRRLRETL